ncbi:hypothetical protein BLJAPNOD_05234 [Ensifer sp. M14]|uniref:hypothetical protein n=1 Tax=Sinorhizobium sp. M14 TaxID=430451 RepID=UPI000E2BCF3C|nr:hypothetical protein [Sinorhizobium sp. M14]RDL48007.1 hypothetical protein BLJAPNOD_05234 [Ensifer sp. M14]
MTTAGMMAKPGDVLPNRDEDSARDEDLLEALDLIAHPSYIVWLTDYAYRPN